MGLQSSIFYMLVTWFAPIAHSLGRSEVVAGVDVMIYQLCAIAGSLTIPLLLRGRMQRVGPAAIPVLSLVGIAGLIALPEGFLVWVILCGLSSGASLGVSLSLFSLRARSHEGASALSGMAQSGGYLIAAAGPIAFGALLSASGGWLAPWCSSASSWWASWWSACSSDATVTCSSRAEVLLPALGRDAESGSGSVSYRLTHERPWR